MREHLEGCPVTLRAVRAVRDAKEGAAALWDLMVSLAELEWSGVITHEQACALLDEGTAFVQACVHGKPADATVN